MKNVDDEEITICPRYNRPVGEVHCPACSYMTGKKKCSYGFRITHMHKDQTVWVKSEV